MKTLTTILFITLTAGFAMAQSPYIHKVFEYRPAPGQFVNELPEYEDGDTPEEMTLKAEECIAKNEQILVSLGGYGGYIVFGFDHLVKNVAGEYDFKILGNAFYAGTNPANNDGSSEPGIVLVSYDANGNGRPDDVWYELAGSEHNKSETLKNYRITYYKPDENKVPTPHISYPYLNDTSYIFWKSNQDEQGYLYRNMFHNQPYYPQWFNTDSIVFTGTKLKNNYVVESEESTFYVQYAYPWGYADNHPNNDEHANFKIEWAVDSLGNSVNLQGIHFVKVYTGINQNCGSLGETSTEIMGAEDLNFFTDTLISGVFEHIQSSQISVFPNPTTDILNVVSSKKINATLHNSVGKIVRVFHLKEGENTLSIRDLANGMYVLKAGQECHKIIKK